MDNTMNQELFNKVREGSIVRTCGGDVFRLQEYLSDHVWRGVLLNKSHEPVIDRTTGKQIVESMHVRAIVRVMHNA